MYRYGIEIRRWASPRLYSMYRVYIAGEGIVGMLSSGKEYGYSEAENTIRRMLEDQGVRFASKGEFWKFLLNSCHIVEHYVRRRKDL